MSREGRVDVWGEFVEVVVDCDLPAPRAGLSGWSGGRFVGHESCHRFTGLPDDDLLAVRGALNQLGQVRFCLVQVDRRHTDRMARLTNLVKAPELPEMPAAAQGTLCGRPKKAQSASGPRTARVSSSRDWRFVDRMHLECSRRPVLLPCVAQAVSDHVHHTGLHRGLGSRDPDRFRQPFEADSPGSSSKRGLDLEVVELAMIVKSCRAM